MASPAISLTAYLLRPGVLRALLVAGAPLRMAVAANLWAGRTLK
jgi:hypothetical protein